MCQTNVKISSSGRLRRSNGECLSHLGFAFVIKLRPFLAELVMSMDVFSFEHPSVLLFWLEPKATTLRPKYSLFCIRFVTKALRSDEMCYNLQERPFATYLLPVLDPPKGGSGQKRNHLEGTMNNLSLLRFVKIHWAVPEKKSIKLEGWRGGQIDGGQNAYTKNSSLRFWWAKNLTDQNLLTFNRSSVLFLLSPRMSLQTADTPIRFVARLSSTRLLLLSRPWPNAWHPGISKPFHDTSRTSRWLFCWKCWNTKH